ncbi:MAG: sigma-70 family RNA polymerase sigma factor [Planctomycetota bacterium]
MKPEVSGPSDEGLVVAAQKGDRDAFAQLVRRYESQVYTMSMRLLSNREDARDLAQEVFLTVYQSLDRFRGEAQFRTWLYRVTINRCRDEIRRRRTVKHTRPVSLEALAGAPGDADGGHALEPEAREPSPEAVARGREAELAVSDAVSRLPDELRETIVLRDVQDLAYDDIARVLEVPVGTVRSRLNRARTRLAELLQPYLEGGLKGGLEGGA